MKGEKQTKQVKGIKKHKSTLKGSPVFLSPFPLMRILARIQHRNPHHSTSYASNGGISSHTAEKMHKIYSMLCPRGICRILYVPHGKAH